MQSFSLEETVSFGRLLGSRLRAGDILALRGPLGIGKTQLARGIAQGYLGDDSAVCSPSFTLINRYDGLGGRRIHHLDLYRLSGIEELESTGYWDSIEDPEALVLIEWLEQVPGARPLEFVSLVLEFAVEDGELGESPRRLSLEAAEQQTDLYQRLQELFE